MSRKYKKYNIRRKITIEGKCYSIYADNEKQYAEKVRRKIEEVETGNKIKGGNTVLKVWAEECISTYKTNMRESTLNSYRSKMNTYILNQIGDMRLKDIKPMHCQKVINAYTGYSKTTINDIYQMLNFLFSKAVENSLIASNPARHITKPSGTRGSRRSITEVERDHIWKVCSQDRRYYLYLLMLECGCRPSEAAEAMGRDIIKAEGYNMLHIRGTKSSHADRIVPIPDELYRLIKNTPKTDYIACNSRGNKITYDNRSRLWNSCKRQLNISMGCKTYRNRLIPPYPIAPDLVPYCLRHTYCTDLARKGIDLRLAQKLMGHSDITLTANIYTNFTDDDIVKAAKILNDNTYDNTSQCHKISQNVTNL